MAIRYTMTSWDSRTAMKAREFVAVSRKDAAANVLYRMIYEMLAADGGLDTERGHRLVREFYACDISPPPLGSYRLQEFNLRGDGEGAYVAFRAHRMA